MSEDLSIEACNIVSESDFHKMSLNSRNLATICIKCKKSCDIRIAGLCAECFKIADAELPEIIKH